MDPQQALLVTFTAPMAGVASDTVRDVMEFWTAGMPQMKSFVVRSTLFEINNGMILRGSKKIFYLKKS